MGSYKKNSLEKTLKLPAQEFIYTYYQIRGSQEQLETIVKITGTMHQGVKIIVQDTLHDEIDKDLML